MANNHDTEQGKSEVARAGHRVRSVPRADDHHRRTTNKPRPATTVVAIVPTKTQTARASARRARASSCALITNAGSGPLKSGVPSISLRALVTRGWLTASPGRASNELAIAARSMFVRATGLPSASSRKSNEASLRRTRPPIPRRTPRNACTVPSPICSGRVATVSEIPQQPAL